MLLPSNVFAMKAYKKKTAVILVFISLFVFIAVAVKSKDNQLEKNDIHYFSDSRVKYELQKSYIELMGSDSEDKIKKSPYIFLQDLHYWNKLEKESSRAESRNNDEDFNEIKNRLLSLKTRYEQSISYQWGLNPQKITVDRWWSFLTYQFLHIDFSHLLMNMIFLFLVVVLLNQFVSGGLIFILYIIGGIGSGVFFLSLLKSPFDSFSLVGASGSISALMMYLALMRGRLGIPWTYFWSLDRSTQGVIYMPAYVLFILFLVKDFAIVFLNMLSEKTVTMNSAIAYSAHVGGALTGLIVYGIVYLMNKKRQIKV